MKQFAYLTFLLTFCGSILYAAEIMVDDAKRVAVHFYFEKQLRYHGDIGIKSVGIAAVHTEFRDGQPVYYVFHMKPAGFVIVPASDALPPVIGYDLAGRFETAGQPPNVAWWMNQYASQVVFAREKGLEPEIAVQKAWAHYLAEDFAPSPERDSWGQVGPLLTTLWDQGWPYNYYCPVTPGGGSGGYAWAGCVATAIGQMTYYLRWPENGQGAHCYIPELHPEYGEQCADFGNTWYRYEEMVDQPSTLNLAIAEYLYHIGVSMDMNYDPGGSAPAGADSTAYFLKLLPTEFIDRDTISDSAWVFMIKSELDGLIPVYYSGWPESGAGHAFVCDGYQDSAYFHFNLGWSGSSNGYYSIDNLAGFNYGQSIILPAFPDTVNYTYPLYVIGNDTLHSLAGSIEDGSGPLYDYLNGNNASWLIDPQNEIDSVINITITFKRFGLYDDDDRLLIYDGEDTTATLLAELSGASLPEPITSTGHKVFIKFITGNTNTAPGFYLNYKSNLPVWCSYMTQITAGGATFDDGSGRFHYYDGSSCMWTINPGLNEPLTIGFTYFDTEQDYDFLKIYDLGSQSLLATYSGYYETPPDPVTAPSGKIMLAFSTNSSVRGQGWEATYPFTAIGEKDDLLSFSFFPNPANGVLNVSFTLHGDATFSLYILDLTGRRVMALEESRMTTGIHTGVYDLGSLETGVYLLRMKAGDALVVKKIILF